MAVIERLSYRHDRESFMCGKADMDDFLVKWEAGRGDDEQLWVVVSEPGGIDIIAYYAVEPDPSDFLTGSTTHRCEDGIIYLCGLATDKRHQRQGWAEKLLLRVVNQILELPPSVGAKWLVTDALDANAQAYLLGRGLGFQLVPPPHRRMAVHVEALRRLDITTDPDE